ncbi:hypothetical protein HPB50_012796 [Hyalomma asiaticum]|uniref:Uncharacterized protein n=1 Tax=Hyalomma asiaticum TaxID=266040 RepID=A0ACB7SM39_HYAAI|nr:hypothetical protein HPB50_012796 [Hyalomma asiaticum]
MRIIQPGEVRDRLNAADVYLTSPIKMISSFSTMVSRLSSKEIDPVRSTSLWSPLALRLWLRGFQT